MVRRLLAALVGVAVVTAGLVAFFGGRDAREVERRSVVVGLERDALHLVLVGRDDLARPLDNAARARLRSSAERVANQLGVVAVFTTPTGVPIAWSEPPPSGRLLRAVSGQLEAPAPRSGVVGVTTIREAGFEVARAPVLVAGELVGVVVVTRSVASIEAVVATRVRSLRWVFLLSIVVAAAVAWLLARTWSRPVREVTAAMARAPFAADPLNPVRPTGPPELRLLGAAYNTMAEEVRALEIARDTVAGDVAHQLRTPLTTVGLRMDQLRAGLDAADEDATRRNAELAARELTRLGQVVDGLLALHRGSVNVADRSDVDVAAVARERAEAWDDLARDRGVRIVVDAPTTAPALAATRAVGQSLDNLIDNALEVAPPGSTIEVTVATEHGRVIAAVRDRGPGMSDVERLHAFDRFWRGPHGSERGLGIGLPIVADLMAASGGHAELRVAPGGGVEAVLTFEPSGDADPADAGPTAIRRPTTPRSPVRPLRVRIASGLLVSTGVALVGTAAAATNTLPPAIQHTAAGVLSRLGVSVPDPGPGGPAKTSDPTRPSDLGRGRAGARGPAPSSGGAAGDSSGPAGGSPASTDAGTPGTDAGGTDPTGAGANPGTTTSGGTPAATAPGQTQTPPGQAKKPTTPPGQSKKPTTPPGQAKKPTTPPGQAKKSTTTT